MWYSLRWADGTMSLGTHVPGSAAKVRMLRNCKEEAVRQQGPSCPRLCWQDRREAGVPVGPERDVRVRVRDEPWNTL